MKKKYSVLLLIFILLLAGCFTISASGIKIPYLENYGTNFRRNIKGITDRLGLNLPQPVNDFLSKTPEPLSTEEKLAIIEKMESEQEEAYATPTPDIPVKSEMPINVTSRIIAQKDAYAAAYASYEGKLLCAIDTTLTCYSPDGGEAWKADVQISNPILKTAGSYIMLAEKGSSKLYLFRGKKKLWEFSNENPIISADVSENGDVVITSDKAHSKGVVTVFNRKGETVFQWNSGKYEVLDADISPASRHLAVSLLNTESGADTKLSFFNMKESESFNSAAIADSIVFDVEFCGETLNAIADNKIIGLDADGNVQWTKDFENKTLHRYSVEDSGYKVCVFDSNNVSEINVISARGGDKSSFESQAFPDNICISDGYLLYNNDRTLIFSSLSGKNPKEYNCTRDIYKLFILDANNLLVVYNSSLEFIHI